MLSDGHLMKPIHRILAPFLFLLTSLCGMGPAYAGLAQDLQDGQHVLLMRHADAPGYGDPAGYVLGKCATQRNLGDAGKKQAKTIGAWLSQQGMARAAKAPLILVTHHVNIQAFTGKVVGVGDMVLVKVNPKGEHLSNTVYPSP